MRVLILVVPAVLMGSALFGCSGTNEGLPRIGPTAPAPVPSPGPLPPQARGPLFGIGVRILPGQTVAGTVEPTDPACFPNWDSSAVCKTYLVTAPGSGRLKATLTWTPPPRVFPMDLFLVSPSGSWVVSEDSDAGKRTVETPVTGGSVYSILAMSYSRSPLQFELVHTFE